MCCSYSSLARNSSLCAFLQGMAAVLEERMQFCLLLSPEQQQPGAVDKAVVLDVNYDHLPW